MAHIYYASDSDPEMQRAKERARETFGYFWRELFWEYRRIVPALDLSAVKVAFSDSPMTVIAQKPGDVEEMWISEIEFDGKTVSGVLLNAPNGLRSIRKGDRAQVQVSTISDWMYAIGGRALGAFTVNQLRQAMSADERADHDGAWGFDFGDPRAPQLVPDSYPEPPAEHPMSVNMSKSLEAELTKSRALLTTPDERGFTLLHELALAGSSSGVTIALAHGADRQARTKHGMTALDLAQAMKWATVIELLTGSRSSR